MMQNSKMVEHEEHSVIYQKLKFPVTIQSELTPRCSHGCVYCYNFWRDVKKPVALEGEPQLDDWLKIGEKLVEAEIFGVVLTGGKPKLLITVCPLCLTTYITQ